MAPSVIPPILPDPRGRRILAPFNASGDDAHAESPAACPVREFAARRPLIRRPRQDGIGWMPAATPATGFHPLAGDCSTT